MDIKQMTPEEKSVMLARLVGEPVDCHCGNDPANMALAWRVGIWAGDNLPKQSVTALNDFWLRKDTYPYEVFMWYEPEAQRLWLDRILQLAIDEGMVENERN